MFHIFKKEKEITLVSIAKGKIIPITSVPDNMFAKQMLGNGIGLELHDGAIHSPQDAVVVMIANTKHAIGLRLKNGVEILIHVGLDTVNLNGEGFKILVEVGDKVETNQLLMSVDMEFMKKKEMCLITPIVITHDNNYKMEILKMEEVQSGVEVIRLYK